MLFKEYKERLFLKNIEEIVINKKVTIRGTELLILSFVKEENSNKLWTVRKLNSNDIDEEVTCFEQPLNTNRDMVRRHIKANSKENKINIAKMNIQNQVANFVGYQVITPNYAYGDQLQIIKHFIESGLINEEFDDIDVNKIVFTIYEQVEDEAFPIINTEEEFDITINIAEETIEKLIEYPMTLKIQEADKDTKIFYRDCEGNEDFFYLNGVIKYDIWQDTLDKIEANINYIPEELRESHRQEALEALANLCPKDKDVTAIYYENEEDIQLRFLSKEYLERKHIYDSGCFGMISASDERIGINGFYKYVDMLSPVDKDFDGEIEIELFSKFEKIEEEVISFRV